MRDGRWRRLLLFDIDGTLVRSGFSRHSRSFEVAMEKHTGRAVPLKAIDTYGQIDNAILRGMLSLAEVPPERMAAVLEKVCFTMVEDFLENEVDMRPHVLPGVRSVLSAIESRGDLLAGLLTGNLEPIAWHKLEKAELHHYFRVGGFGNEAEERSDLVPVVLEKCRRTFGRQFSGHEILVIGDTPRDIECARLNGALAVAVATGHFSAEMLRESGADLVLESFADPAPLLSLISRGDPAGRPYSAIVKDEDLTP